MCVLAAEEDSNQNSQGTAIQSPLRNRGPTKESDGAWLLILRAEKQELKGMGRNR